LPRGNSSYAGEPGSKSTMLPAQSAPFAGTSSSAGYSGPQEFTGQHTGSYGFGSTAAAAAGPSGLGMAPSWGGGGACVGGYGSNGRQGSCGVQGTWESGASVGNGAAGGGAWQQEQQQGLQLEYPAPDTALRAPAPGANHDAA
jgi:hypothetical protein